MEDYNMDARRLEITALAPGQAITLFAAEFARLYPFGWPTHYRTARESFLSKMIGAAYGAWRVDESHTRPEVTISRHEPGPDVVYVDPDQEHLYERKPDGRYVPISTPDD